MKADMLPNGLIALSPVDSRSRARGLCRYIMQDGVIKAEVSASQLASNEEYIAIIWTGSRPQTLGDMRKTQEGCMVSGDVSGKTMDAALIALKEPGGIRVLLAGRPLGSKLNMNEMLSKVRMHYYRKEEAGHLQQTKEAMPHRENESKTAEGMTQPPAAPKSVKERKPPSLEPLGYESDEAAAIPIAPVKMPTIAMEQKPEHILSVKPVPNENCSPMTPDLSAKLPKTPLGYYQPATQGKAAEPERTFKAKLPQTPLVYYQPARPNEAAQNAPRIKLPQAPLPQAPEATSKALNTILKRANTLFAPKTSEMDDMYGLGAVKKRDQWHDEVEQLIDGIDMVDYADADATASKLPATLDHFIHSQNPRAIMPEPEMAQYEAETELAEEIPIMAEQRVKSGNRENPNRLLRHSRPTYSKPISAPFQGKYPGAAWVLARYPGTQYPHYLAAQWKRNNRNLLVIAVPGDYAPNPPSWLKGFTRHRVTRWGQGYWICITDYDTGKLWEG